MSDSPILGERKTLTSKQWGQHEIASAIYFVAILRGAELQSTALQRNSNLMFG